MSGLTLSPRNKASLPQRHVARESDPAKGQATQASGVPTWGCGSCSRPGQRKPASMPLGA